MSRLSRPSSIVAVTALLAGCGGHADRAAPPARTTAVDRGTLVVVGDSLAAGRFADTQDEAFPQRLAAAVHDRLELVGIPGATTAQLGAQAVPAGGDVAVVEAGTNDFVHQTPRKQFADDYRALLAKVAAASPGARLVCLTIWMPKDVAAQIPATIPPSAYDATIRRACGKGVVADLEPFLAARGPVGRPTFLGPGDAFHPNSDGHAAIARAIEAQLR